MNPWAFICIAVGLLLIIIGVKGSQHTVASALVGHPTGGSSNTPAGNNAPPTTNTGPILA